MCRPKRDPIRAFILQQRLVHCSLLSKPRARYLRPWPDPALERTLPAKIPGATLRAKPNARIIMLYQNKPARYAPRLKYTPPPKPKHYVQPSALKGTASDRIIELAVSRYTRMAMQPPPPVDKRARSRYRRKCRRYRRKRSAWLEKRAAPRKVHLPKRPPKPPAFPLKHFLKRLETLAPPFPRCRYVPPPPPKKPWQPPPRLPPGSPKPPGYEPTERTLLLSIPKRIPSEAIKDLMYNPYQVSEGAKKYVPTENMLKLAIPRPRSKAVDNDFREDAFTISPLALKYVASKRMIELAKPIKRK